MDTKLSLKEANSLFADLTWSVKFPPILSVDQVAELLQVPKNTIYSWSSQGLFNDCKVRIGKHLRFYRDRLMQKISEGNIHENK